MTFVTLCLTGHKSMNGSVTFCLQELCPHGLESEKIRESKKHRVLNSWAEIRAMSGTENIRMLSSVCNAPNLGCKSSVWAFNHQKGMVVVQVYESNHSDNNLVGSIHGPCQVLPPLQYQQEIERRAKGTSEGLPPIFLCRYVARAPFGNKLLSGSILCDVCSQNNCRYLSVHG